jgi:3-dehydroquinate synthase
MDSTSLSPDTRVKVDLGPRAYDIQVVTGGTLQFGAFVRQALAKTWAASSCRSALIITDDHLADLSLPSLYRTALEGAGIAAETVVVPPGEASKSLDEVARLYDELVMHKADRHTLIVALGGGVVGDLAGFVAATYARGLRLLMVPTTLLAQVDSSVGGKVGVNHPRAKNMIGAFHQPLGVWIDTLSLKTLDDRELRCGLAEVVKYGVISSSSLFSFLERHTEEILERKGAALEHIILESCRIKSGIVERDEREEGGERALLNFGHTIAHAIEAVAGYDGPFRHGEAVAVGMVAESRLAQRLGWVPGEVVDRQIQLLKRFGLPVAAPGIDPDRLMIAMSRDKKNQLGRLRFVIPRSIGKVELTDSPGEDDVRAIISCL